jgi:hypothetical protein
MAAPVGCLRGDFAGLCSGCLLRGGLQAIEKRLREGDICTALDLEGIPADAPIEHAHRVRPRTRMSGSAQESCRALLTSVMIAAAVGSVRPPARVVGTPRASASTR